MFIGAHVANNAEDLATVGALARQVSEPVRRHRRAHRRAGPAAVSRPAKFFIKYADRILFGTDGPRSRERLLLPLAILGNRRRVFSLRRERVSAARLLGIYGVGLPDDVLKKLYSENAARLVPGVKERLK